jgi:hypothetical protein
MSERLFEVELTASFVTKRAFPTAGEIAYGYSEGFLSRAGVVATALIKMKAGLHLTRAEERAALLLSDELDCLDDLVADLGWVDEPSEQRERFWLLMILAWAYEHREDLEDALGVVELIYSDFGYPDEIEGIVRFMPLQAGHDAGVAALERRWAEFVDRVGEEYRQRNESMMA